MLSGPPVVQGHDLAVLLDELGVEGSLHTLPHNACPAAAGKALHLVVDGLELALADLEHQRPVGPALGLAVLRLCAISLQSQCQMSAHVQADLPLCWSHESGPAARLGTPEPVNLPASWTGEAAEAVVIQDSLKTIHCGAPPTKAR